MALRFLTADQIVHMHDVLLRRYGGEEGRGHRGPGNEGVDAAVQAVKNSYYEDPRELAAAYAVYVVQGHVFMDGNKRAGRAAMLAFLHANGLSAGAAARDPRVMVELQRRAEAGESSGSLIAWLSGLL
jgi:death-on-curing family protein